jgi:hypothetical protein
MYLRCNVVYKYAFFFFLIEMMILIKNRWTDQICLNESELQVLFFLYIYIFKERKRS